MSSRKPLAGVSVLLALSLGVSTVAAGVASAQDAPPPPQGYDQGQSQGYDQGPPPGDNQGPPPGYDPNNPNNPPPPPQGYNGADQSAQARAQDQAYAANAQQWMAANCIQKQNNSAAGAVVGGVLGAVLGSAIGGRGNHFAGAVVGGTVGAVAGGAIGSSSSGPGCPSGYVVREGAPAFYAPAGVVYAAPGWYNPWVWAGGAWVYRPYPYHRYYYGRYYGPRRYYGHPYYRHY